MLSSFAFWLAFEVSRVCVCDRIGKAWVSSLIRLITTMVVTIHASLPFSTTVNVSRSRARCATPTNERAPPPVTWNQAQDGGSQMNALGACTSVYRNPYRNSKARISYLDGQLSVEIDALYTGSYVSCFGPVPVALPTGYRFGLSAKTGPIYGLFVCLFCSELIVVRDFTDCCQQTFMTFMRLPFTPET
jgi:hypothetical protein